MKTFLEICKKIGNMPNSELSSNIKTLADVTDKQINALNGALLTIWGLTVGWNLRFARSTFKTVVGKSEYNRVSGNICKKGISINGNYLSLIENPEKLTEQSGTPTGYYIEGAYIVLHPKPADVYTVTVKYRNRYSVSGSEDQDCFSAATDTLNIPEDIETEFIQCLGHLTNQILVGKPTNKHYLEHSTRYASALRILKMADRGTEDSTIRLNLV